MFVVVHARLYASRFCYGFQLQHISARVKVDVKLPELDVV